MKCVPGRPSVDRRLPARHPWPRHRPYIPRARPSPPANRQLV